MGVIRIVLVRLHDADDEARHSIVAAAREAFPTIPGVVDFEAGVGDEDWDLVLLVHFRSLQDVERYRVHPLHVAFVQEHLKPKMQQLEARNFVV